MSKVKATEPYSPAWTYDLMNGSLLQRSENGEATDVRYNPETKKLELIYGTDSKRTVDILQQPAAEHHE